MNNLAKKMTLTVLCLLGTLMAGAQQLNANADLWASLIGHRLQLVAWGDWQNGKEQTRNYDTNGEYWLIRDESLTMYNSRDGNVGYSYKMKDYRLMLESRTVFRKKNLSAPRWVDMQWIDWDSQSNLILYCIDNLGVYRYFRID